MYSFLLMKVTTLAGLGIWLGLACYNNIVDRGTNRILLANMFTMTEIEQDGRLAQQLLRHRLPESFAAPVLWLVVVYQAVVSLCLLGSALMMFATGLVKHHVSYNFALSIANYSIDAFMLLWLTFLIGGLWFGYWIKMWQVQLVHLLLLIISLLVAIVLNLL